MNNIKRFLNLVSMGIAMSLLVGCWDSVEISDRSIILEFAIDKNDEYEPSEEVSIGDAAFYDITYSIPDMAKLSGTQGLAEDVKTNILVQAPTVGASVDELESKTRNTLSFGNVKAIMVGESLLQDRKLFKQAMDSILREMLIARNVPMLLVKGKASDAVEIQNSQQPIVGLYIMNYFNNKERAVAYFKPQLLGNFIADMQDTGISTLPIFKILGEETEEQNGETADSRQEAEKDRNLEGIDITSKVEEGTNDSKLAIKEGIEISGGALVRNYELVDYLTKEEVRGQLLIEGDVKNTAIVVEYKGKPVTYNILRHKSKIGFENEDDPQKIKCTIKMHTSGTITEYSADDARNTLETYEVEEIRALVEEQLVKEAELAIDKSREVNLDFLGIGQEMYRKKPKVWENYKEDWYEETYKYLSIEVESEVDIKGTGILK